MYATMYFGLPSRAFREFSLHEQAVRQLERGILQELEQLAEYGNSGHLCWRTAYNPLVSFDTMQKVSRGHTAIDRLPP